MIDHQQMIAHHVIGIDIAAGAGHRRRRQRAHFIIENGVAKRLGGDDFGFAGGKPHFQQASPVDRRGVGEQGGGQFGGTREGKGHRRLRWFGR